MTQGFSIEFCGNLNACRLEVKISRLAGPPDERLVAVLYDTSDGVVVSYFGPASANSTLPGLEAAIAEARTELLHYINRTGANPPQRITRPGLALWLTERDDETVVGRPVQ